MKFGHVEAISSLAVVGATGLVGQEFLGILKEHRVNIEKVRLFASESSVGEYVEVGEKRIRVEALEPGCFNGVEVAFFSTPNAITQEFVPQALESDCLVVDDSSVYRMEDHVPLIVPQINGALLRSFDGRLVSNPNCATIPVAMCLKPLQEKFGLKRVVISTYQSVSGAGTKAYEELSKQTVSLLNGMDSEAEVFPHPIAFNCLPLIGSVLEDGQSEEEDKIVNELRKILVDSELAISATAVRIPTFCGHGASVNVELADPIDSIESVREMLDSFPGVKVLDNPASHIYPTNLESVGSDPVFVGRIRRDPSVPSGINFWVMTDNLRKGASLNVLEILEALYHYRRMV